MSSIQTMPPTRSKRRKPAFHIFFKVKSVWSLVGEKKPASASAPLEKQSIRQAIPIHKISLEELGGVTDL